MVDTGRHPCMGFEPQQPHSNLESVNEFVEHMALGIEEAKAALTKAKDEYTMYYNRRLDPFVVEACVSHGAYYLALPPHFYCLHPIFPMVKLSLVHPDPIPGQRPAPPPPPTLINGEKEYEVEAILDS
jgi:hypothetical protein